MLQEVYISSQSIVYYAGASITKIIYLSTSKQ